MKVVQFMRPVMIISVLITLSGTAGCVYEPYRGGPPVYRSAYRHYPYHYYYYPSTRVYFHLHSGDYYYHRDKRWHRAHVLPPHVFLDRRDRVRVWIDASRPHDRQRDHVKRYKPSPRYHADRHRDRDERAHNRREHKKYRNR